MFSLNTKDKSPIYQQIMDQLMLFISTGIMAEGDKLPSIREMASDLGINPNTVARAYAELEQNNIIETIPKKGAFIAVHSLAAQLEDKARAELKELCQRYRNLGLSGDLILTLTQEVLTDVANS